MSLGPIHPRMHDRACELLGLPKGSPLTEADVWRAAEIEIEQADALTAARAAVRGTKEGL